MLTRSVKGVVRHRQILGVTFFSGEAKAAIHEVRNGGLVVVPAAPALKNITTNGPYRDALVNADLVLADSGLMVLVWNILERDAIRRLSGLAYLKELLRDPFVRQRENTFFVMASQISSQTNLAWLAEAGILPDDRHVYIAPLYRANNIADEDLIRILNERRPGHVIITVGGGTQECLGIYLKRNLDYLPAIHCIGAALAFLSGDQVRIPMWADRLYLGWLYRCVSEPKRYLPRYWSARTLPWLIVKYRHRLPMESSESVVATR